MPEWLFADCFSQVGDSAETISLLWPQLKNQVIEPKSIINEALKKELENLESCLPLHWWMESMLPKLNNLSEPEQDKTILRMWNTVPNHQHYVLNKLITGGFRIGVSKGIVVKAISKAYSLDETTILERLMKPMKVSDDWFHELTQPEDATCKDRGAAPYPFFLASPMMLDRLVETDVGDWCVEWKWDGIRGQLIRREKGIYLWSRGEELINDAFPEIISMGSYLPNGTVLDGEIICWDRVNDQPFPFSMLQKRLGRKSVSKKLLTTNPVVFIAYDLLEETSNDLRTLPLNDRVSLLKNIQDKVNSPALIYKQQKSLKSWDEIDSYRDDAGIDGAEGLMIKKKDSPYLAGRKRGFWWKYKHEPMTLDAVLIYAQSGSGKRANLFTDYTFALWNEIDYNSGERQLVTFAKAYSGLDNDEILTLDRWIRSNTRDRFGPTRVVEPFHVFEIGFEGIMTSKRHKCGMAVRFPRILRWRKDKQIMDADCLEQARQLCRN